MLDAEIARTLELLQEGRQLQTVSQSDLTSQDAELVPLHHVRHDLELAGRALVLLASALDRHRKAMDVLFGGPEVAEDSRGTAAACSRELALDAELYVRQIYELLYAIQVLVRRLPAERQIPRPDDRAELERLCLYRGSLLVHRESAVRLTRGARMWGRNRADMRFGIGLQPISEDDAAQLQSIFRRVAPLLSNEKQDEKNWNEQLQHLYDEWPKVPAQERGDVRALIRRNGVKSDPPIVLAQMVRKLSEVFFRT